MKGGGTEKDFIGFAVLSTTRFPLKGELSNHKGIFDEILLLRYSVIRFYNRANVRLYYPIRRKNKSLPLRNRSERQAEPPLEK